MLDAAETRQNHEASRGVGPRGQAKLAANAASNGGARGRGGRDDQLVADWNS